MLHPRVVILQTAALLFSVFLILSACAGAEEEASPAGVGPTDPSLPTILKSSPTASPPPDPFITDTGIRILIIVDGGDTTSGVNICEADAQVDVLNGVVLAVAKAPAAFTASVGEPVYRADGTLFSEPVFMSVEVNRRPDGKLEAGWRHCEFIPDNPEP